MVFLPIQPTYDSLKYLPKDVAEAERFWEEQNSKLDITDRNFLSSPETEWRGEMYRSMRESWPRDLSFS